MPGFLIPKAKTEEPKTVAGLACVIDSQADEEDLDLSPLPELLKDIRRGTAEGYSYLIYEYELTGCENLGRDYTGISHYRIRKEQAILKGELKLSGTGTSGYPEEAFNF